MNPYSAAGIWLALLVGCAAAAGDGDKGKPMKELMPWYLSGEEIRQEISNLLGSCQADAQMFSAGNLDVVRVKAMGSTAGTKAVMVFGEHGRELISPESALGLVRSLCGKGGQAQLASHTLAKGVEFVLVPNANPSGRKAVEEGYYCKRTNENGVDLNRNWGDDHRNGLGQGDEANPGPQGFSEPETQALRDLVDQEKPDVYLSVHSGDYMLGSSPGYEGGPPADQAASEVLKPISDKYCHGACPYGGLHDILGYNAAGCDIDYVHEHSGVPYAFTFEIYNGFSDGEALVQRQARHSRLRGRTLEPAHPEGAEDPQLCLATFLPTTEARTKEVVGNWTGAFLELGAIVADRKR